MSKKNCFFKNFDFAFEFAYFWKEEKEIWDTLIILLNLRLKEKLKKCENWQIDLCIDFVLNPSVIRLSLVFGLGF